MHPADRRRTKSAASGRLRRAGRTGSARRGFTLVEMLISVTLVLMMMLMFAEIYGIAQQTISTQKGIAENDQKARLLTQILHRDLATRTFRSVYPFKLEDPTTWPPASNPDQTTQLLELRKGYFSISENVPENDTDDVLQLTVQVDVYGGPGERLYGKAPTWSALPSGAALSPPQRSLPTPPPGAVTTLEDEQNHPEYDDGVFGNNAGMSGTAEISWFLRDGNLFRTVLLVREPYSKPSDVQPLIDPLWAGVSPYDDYATFSTQYPSAGYPAIGSNPARSFWGDFDYSAHRWQPSPGVWQWQFHGPDGLSNNFSAPPTDLYFGALYVFPSLGVPHLRFGHQYSVLGNPLEYDSGGAFFGRYTAPERANPTFPFPGNSFSPFDGTATPPASFGSLSPQRRGVDLMLSNVHSFDIEVWDDVVGDWVDLGHTRTGTNPYTGIAGEPGFYSASRLRAPISKATLAAGEDFHFDDPSVTSDYGNRYDTWHPQMVMTNGTNFWRNGRAPYRPQQSNPDPNTANFNDPTSTDWYREPVMEFGDNTLDDDGDFIPQETNGDDTDAEAPLRGVRIVVRYLDAASGQMRQSTIEASLVD